MDTMIRSLSYSFKQALRQIWRNKVMSVASMFSITAMLLILGLFFILTVNVNMATEGIKDQFNTVEVFLLDDVDLGTTSRMKTNIEAMEDVEKVEYITKAEALEEFKQRFGENAYLLDGLTTNPLPNSLRVTLSDLSQGDTIAEVCRNMDGVEDVRYYATEVNKVISVTNAMQKVSLIVVLFLIVVSIVVVSNTIKITVEARKDEIAIMKYIGATNWFIRGPMLTEGLLIGFLAAVISCVITSAVYAQIVYKYNDQIQALVSTSLVDAQYMTISLVWIFISLGLSIGMVGSIISTRRYLKQ